MHDEDIRATMILGEAKLVKVGGRSATSIGCRCHF